MKKTTELNKIKLEVIENPIFSIQLKVMRAAGLVQDESQQYQWLHFSRFIITLGIFVTGGCLTFIKIYRGLHQLDGDEITRGSAFHFCSVGAMCVNAINQRKRIIALVHYIHDDLLSLRSNTDDMENELYSKTIKYVRRLVYILWVPTLASGVLSVCEVCFRVVFLPETIFNVADLNNGTAQPLLMFKMFPFGEVIDNFVVGVIGPCLIVLLNINILPIWNTFIASLMMYVILKVQIISKRFQEMDFLKISEKFKKIQDIQKLSDVERIYWYHKMCEYCVKEQIKILWFVRELELLIRIPVFIDMIIYSILICFFLFSFIVANLDEQEYFIMIHFIIDVLFYIWLYNWHGTLISESYQEMCFAIYSCNWYDYPMKLQKTIRFLMMECRKPLVVRAVLVELKVGTLVDVVRCAFSYFNILRNLNFNKIRRN